MEKIIDMKSVKSEYIPELKRLGFKCDNENCDGNFLFKECISRKRKSPFKEEIIHLNECYKCKKTIKSKFTTKLNLIELSDEDFKKEFVKSLKEIGNNKGLRKDYITNIKKVIFRRFFYNLNDKDKKTLEKLYK